MRVSWDLWASSLCDRIHPVTNAWSKEMQRPKHAVSDVLMALAEDKGPEENRLIESRPYALKRHPQSGKSVDV